MAVAGEALLSLWGKWVDPGKSPVLLWFENILRGFGG